jgi:hypothetical protein
MNLQAGLNFLPENEAAVYNAGPLTVASGSARDGGKHVTLAGWMGVEETTLCIRFYRCPN